MQRTMIQSATVRRPVVKPPSLADNTLQSTSRLFPVPNLLPRDLLMKIHEYQGKEILAKFGVPVPRGIPAYTVQEAVEAAQKLGGPVWVVKAQIHAGGRG